MNEHQHEWTHQPDAIDSERYVCAECDQRPRGTRR